MDRYLEPKGRISNLKDVCGNLTLKLPSFFDIEIMCYRTPVLLLKFRKLELDCCTPNAFAGFGTDIPHPLKFPDSQSRSSVDNSEAKVTCVQNLPEFDFPPSIREWPSEETAKPVKLLFDREKSTCDEVLTSEDIEKTVEIIRRFLIKKCLTGTGDERQKSQNFDQKNENCKKTDLECKLRVGSQPRCISQEALNSENEKVKILQKLPNFANTEGEECGNSDDKPERKACVGDLITLSGVSQHAHKNRRDDEEKRTSGKTLRETKLERENLELKRKLHNTYRLWQTLATKMDDVERENSSVKGELKLLQIRHSETLTEFGRLMVEHTAEENKKPKTEKSLGISLSSKVARKNGSSNLFQIPNENITSEYADANEQAVQGAEALVETNQYEEGNGKEEMVKNEKDERKTQEEETKSLYKSTAKHLEKEKKGGGKGNNQSGKKMGEKKSSSLASTSADESESQGSTRQNYEDLSFSVQQDYPNDRDCISLSNQPLTSVATTLYNNYKLLLLTLAERLLSSDAEQLRNWACQNFSIDTSQKVTDVLFQLDHKEIINASDLNVLKDFFESIVRFDLVYIIDAFLLGDYDVLRYNPRKPEVDANREQRLRQRVRSNYTSPLSGVSSHSAFLQNGTEENPEALGRSENNGEVQTLIPHQPSQTPFPTFPTHQHTTNTKYTSTYQNDNPSSSKYAQQALEPHSTRFTAAVVVADGPVKGESRLNSSNSSASANPTVNQRRNTQTVGSNGFKLSKPHQPDTVQSNSRSPRNQDPDVDQDVEGNWLCNHYKRRCFVKFECCDKFWPCHRCHNNQSTCGRKKLKSRDTKKLKCANCNKVQEFGQYCRDCNAKFAKYYCGLCKHLTGTDDHPYHCDKCGICRIHGNRSFHCDICGVCLDVQLRGNHKCREGSAHDECCICLEDAFTGCQILPCSHKVHKECATQMIRSGIRRCPICRESFAHKLERRPLSGPKNRSGK